MSQPSLFKAFSYICLYTSNLHEVAQWYITTLGLEPISLYVPNDPKVNFVGLKFENITLGIEPYGTRNPGEKNKSQNPILLQFKAENLEHLQAMTEQLERHNVRFLNKMKVMSYGTVTNFLDPDGNKLEILLEK